ncbi:aminodeoxychorismate/anthranilate synthase component II [Candidatus Gracilibacteria bacterium]|nr:aminodeoxychorismate/anthranilate synthase component II [Candidatus Gracilibacteria bacterium]NUJ98949.1 aminodeoxychorismate/anthranilate synthase component II [Candidatus Gracilibacteria bacterium]
MKVIIIDNYDSFTYNIYNFICIIFKKHKISINDILVIKNNEKTLKEIIQTNPTHIIFGPGQGTVYRKEDIGISEELLDYFKDKIKILGICLGHQLIYKYFGGNVIVANEIMHGKEDFAIINNESIIFKGLKDNIKIMRYHSQIGENISLPNNLEIIAKTNNIIMGIKHKKYDIWGVQFHPESIGTPDGLKILKNFLFN